MSAAAEIQHAARVIRRTCPETATFHRAVATLLDSIALSAPNTPTGRFALKAAREYLSPSPPKKRRKAA